MWHRIQIDWFVRFSCQDGREVILPAPCHGLEGVEMPQDAQWFDFFGLQYYADRDDRQVCLDAPSITESDCYCIGRRYNREELISSGLLAQPAIDVVLDDPAPWWVVYHTGHVGPLGYAHHVVNPQDLGLIAA